MSTYTQAHVSEASVIGMLGGTTSNGTSAIADELGGDEPAFADRSAKALEGLSDPSAVLDAAVVMVLVAFGSLSLFPLWQNMARLWATDPLRSIGTAFPLVACIGVLAAWRRLGWRTDGTFWALLPVALSILLARAVPASALVLTYYGQSLIHLGLVLFLYGAGVVLLFGGPRLLRASIAPLGLLLFINPVPHAFNLWVDMPLQNLSAATARSFAHFIGLEPTGVQLRMMFAPDFGMFIAPGCNGVRGSITLGYLALIFGYTRRLRPRMLILVSFAAFLLGYALNLLRLCVLVVYYRAGISFPELQGLGTVIDYVIGCTLFLFAAAGLGLLIRSLEPNRVAGVQLTGPVPVAKESRSRRSALLFRCAAVARSVCFLALCTTFIVPRIRSASSLPALRPNEQVVLSSFPATIGPYKLARTWAEHDGNGMIALAMAEYSTPSDKSNTFNRFTLGLWVGSAHHLVADSKFIRGERADWTGSFDAIAKQALPVHFVTSFYDDGIRRQYDAESSCTDTGCSDHLAVSGHHGFFSLSPGFSNLGFAMRGKQLPILLRREWLESDPGSSAAQSAQFEADARIFVRQIDLQRLVVQDGSQF